jgi:hypothetical protein
LISCSESAMRCLKEPRLSLALLYCFRKNPLFSYAVFRSPVSTNGWNETLFLFSRCLSQLMTAKEKCSLLQSSVANSCLAALSSERCFLVSVSVIVLHLLHMNKLFCRQGMLIFKLF